MFVISTCCPIINRQSPVNDVLTSVAARQRAAPVAATLRMANIPETLLRANVGRRRLHGVQRTQYVTVLFASVGW